MDQTENRNKRNIALTMVGILLIVAIIIGTSYAYWLKTSSQKTINKITSDCVQVKITDVSDAINLEKTYPITDEEAETIPAYTFKLENICSTTTEFNINLEVMELENQLDSNFVAVSFNGETKKILGTLPTVEPTYKKDDYTANESYKLSSGTLEAKASEDYTIKLWMDESVTSTDAMNKSFISKISVTSGTNLDETSSKTLADMAKVGDYVEMTPTSTSYTISGEKTGCTETTYCNGVTDQTINPSELNLWRVIKKNDDGTIEIISENESSDKIMFYHITGYMNYIGTLNEIAKQYENSKYTVSSRYIGYNNQTEILTDASKFDTRSPWETSTDSHGNQYETEGGGDVSYEIDTNLINNVLGTLQTPNNNSYFLASRTYWIETATSYGFSGRIVSQGFVGREGGSYYRGGWYHNNTLNSLRPIVVLKSGLTATGSGTSEDHWILSEE